MGEDVARADADIVGGRSRSEVAAVYRVALVHAGHPKEKIRVLAAGTMAAASWALGATDRAPRTRRRIRGPTLVDLQVEYRAALEAHSTAPDPIADVHDTGVIDLLGFLIDPAQDTAWWQRRRQDTATAGEGPAADLAPPDNDAKRLV